MGPQDVGFVLVADVRHVPRLYAQDGVRGVEEPRVRLREADVVRVDDGLDESRRPVATSTASADPSELETATSRSPRARSAARPSGTPGSTVWFHSAPRHGRPSARWPGSGPPRIAVRPGRPGWSPPPHVPNHFLQVEAADGWRAEYRPVCDRVGAPRARRASTSQTRLSSQAMPAARSQVPSRARSGPTSVPPMSRDGFESRGDTVTVVIRGCSLSRATRSWKPSTLSASRRRRGISRRRHGIRAPSWMRGRLQGRHRHDIEIVVRRKR